MLKLHKELLILQKPNKLFDVNTTVTQSLVALLSGDTDALASFQK